MIRWSFFFLLLALGMVHVSAFLKAYALLFARVGGNIARGEGLYWLISGALFCTAAFLFLRGRHYWTPCILGGLVLSECMVLRHGPRAGLLTVTDVLVLVLMFGDLETPGLLSGPVVKKGGVMKRQRPARTPGVRKTSRRPS